MYFQSHCGLETLNKTSFLLLSLQFQFVNSYLSLFYIGFYLKDMERLKEVSNISLSVLWSCFLSPSFFCFSYSFGFQTSVTAAVSRSSHHLLSLASMHWLCKPPIHTWPVCWCEEDAAGLVSVTESAEAGPRQFAAVPLLQDPDACSLCSLVLHSVTQIQSTTPSPHSSFWIIRESWATTAGTLHALLYFILFLSFIFLWKGLFSETLTTNLLYSATSLVRLA